MAEHNKINAINLGLALGFTCSLLTFVLGILAYLTGWGTDMVNNIGLFYHGYAATLMGSLIGGVYGMLKGFLVGFIASFFYNLLNTRTS